MHLHVSDHIRGRVDIVPGCCYVATEFVCVWFFPILPRRSLLFFADPDDFTTEIAIPVRLSIKSLLFAYIKPILILWAVFAVAFPFTMFFDSLVKPDIMLEFVLVAAAFLAVPCLALFALRRASLASPRRRATLAKIEGLPPEVVMKLRSGLAETKFRQLNADWNAEPNAPEPSVEIVGGDVVVSFRMNSFAFPDFTLNDLGRLRFHSCNRYSFGVANDEAWYRGQCRFSDAAPHWGEFYEVSGDLRLAECAADWIDVGAASEGLRHFLFYFRDATFECDAMAWSLEVWRPETKGEPTTLGAHGSAIAEAIVFRRGSTVIEK